MCAIAGMINLREKLKADKSVAEKMITTLKRRGPDSDGIYRRQNALLVHTRLAIIDPENAVQPMIYKNYGRELALVYNGELYNTAELRKELENLGCKFQTNSDTETVLLSYAMWGKECVNKFNGIFAFAVWDEKNHTLFTARDRIGVKPFFYTIKDNTFYFASEIKGLLCHKEISARLTANGIREIMLLGPARTCGCGVLEGIEELKPGEYGILSQSGFRKKQYWDFGTNGEIPFEDSFEEVEKKTASLVYDSISRQTVSDVPVCTFLSGGLDSSLISSVTKKVLDEKGMKLHTYSVEYRDNQKYFKAGKFQPNSDDEYIKIMAEYLGSVHHRIVVDTPELVDALSQAPEARDLPGMADVDSSLLLFCKEVRKDFKVALSGECADEIFGGYPWYRDKDIRMTDGFPWSQSTAYRASLLKDDFTKDDISPQDFVYSKYLETIGKVKEDNLSPLEKRMREMMRLNMEWFMQVLLDRKDRMSMYNGLEVRVPFCDYRIVEYLYRVPWEYKDYLGREKGLLREAMKKWLPEKVLWRKKSPYPKTHNPAYEEAVRKRLEEELAQTNCPILQLLKKEEIERLMYHGEKVQWYGQLMNDPQIMAYLIQVNYWMKLFNITLA